jgi:translocation protein SEC62
MLAKQMRLQQIDPAELSNDVAGDEKPSPIEYEVAKYLRAKLPEKKTTLVGVKVDYFIASKAIDCLLDSKWALRAQGSEQDALFTTRESVADYLDLMLRHKFFHRAKKIIVKEKKKKKDLEAKDEKERAKGKEDADSVKEDAVKGEKKDKKSKKEVIVKEKKKVKLDMHMEQIVIDSNEPYVWIYEPLSIKSCLFGFLLVFGVVAVCLFPLWPSCIRTWVYYLSVAVASFLVFIIGLALCKCPDQSFLLSPKTNSVCLSFRTVKLIIFVIIWGITFGRHHFWIFPNLTEDVGFFESFWPLYQYENKSNSDKDSSDSDSASGEEPAKSAEVADLSNEKKKKKVKKAEEVTVSQDEKEVCLKESKSSAPEDEHDSEVSENDSVDNNGFEIVNNKDVPEILNLKL